MEKSWKAKSCVTRYVKALCICILSTQEAEAMEFMVPVPLDCAVNYYFKRKKYRCASVYQLKTSILTMHMKVMTQNSYWLEG